MSRKEKGSNKVLGLLGVMNETEALGLMPVLFIYFLTAKLFGSVPPLPNNVHKNEFIQREREGERDKKREQGKDRGTSSTILPAALQQKSTQHTVATTQPPALHRTDCCMEGEE